MNTVFSDCPEQSHSSSRGHKLQLTLSDCVPINREECNT